MEFLMDFVDDDDVFLLLMEDLAMEDDDWDEEEGLPERVQVDIESWRRLGNAEFKKHFRMDRTVFQRLVVAIGDYLDRHGRIRRIRTPLDACVMMGLWPLCNPDTYRSSGLHFGKDKSVIHFHYRYVIEVLRALSSDYIKWPSPAERDNIKASFERKYGYIGAVGCIDGILIEITAPLEEAQRFWDRHDQYSILVQAVCDDRLLYRDVYAGEAGSIGDARAFQRSPLSNNLLVRADMLSEGEHVLGDGAYPLTSQILIPYVNDGHLTARQRKHNYVLSSCRCSIERSFAALRGKFRRLKMLPMRNANYLTDHIMASFVLHNFIILEGHKAQGLPSREREIIPPNQLRVLLAEASNGGALKREYIATYLERQHVVNV